MRLTPPAGWKGSCLQTFAGSLGRRKGSSSQEQGLLLCCKIPPGLWTWHFFRQKWPLVLREERLARTALFLIVRLKVNAGTKEASAQSHGGLLGVLGKLHSGAWTDFMSIWQNKMLEDSLERGGFSYFFLAGKNKLQLFPIPYFKSSISVEKVKTRS